MSKSDDKASGEGQDERQSDSVYDFLYQDARRVGSFLAQFDDSGHLQQVRQAEMAKRALKRGFKLTAGAGVPLVGSGNVGFEKNPSDAGSETSERVYDPLWTNARTLLDYLAGANLLHRDVTKARIGQFVLATGSLTILDLATLKAMWDIPAIQKIIASGLSGTALAAMSTSMDRNAKARTATNLQAQQMNALKPILEVLKILPHGLQARLLTKDQKRIWCGLHDGSLVGSASDLMLKHGSTISGEWNMLGVLDAEPDSDANDQSAVPQDEVAFFLTSLAPFARTALGRPATAYGMTPLLIFREVTG